ncbi:hypothetical protein SLEP1_g34845 [Rubroshorea leprosula]|uniref:Reverse transcriptase zinc-binding domain-containing protein n=1 Tax=Rubroshorea leprosula TaxID=152421 RepID=A0AAV5KLA2_9ROSI|nr:hypothetical protein SLEP1_g34845 [Rubroshorea leprosula]
MGEMGSGLWKKVLLEKYYGARGEVGVGETRRRRVSKIWEDIVSLGKEGSEMVGIVGNSFTWEVGDGNRVKFWKDVWLERRNLGMDFPRLKNVATNVDIKVGEMGEWCEGVLRWKIDWRRELVGRAREEQISLLTQLEGVTIREGVGDRRIWQHDKSGNYSVRKAISMLIDNQRVLDSDLCKAIWNKFLLGRVCFFAWRLFLDRLPTKMNLERRGIHVSNGNIIYVRCNEEEEDLAHIIIRCKFTHQVWMKCLKWWAFYGMLPNPIHEAYNQIVLGMSKARTRNMWSNLFLTIGWSLWNAHNNTIFKAQEISMEDAFANI